MSDQEAWEHFIYEIEDARAELGNPKIVWYRGHGSAVWDLRPTICRDDNLPKEQAVFNEFRRAATRLFEEQKTDWDVLFDMQHYGVPTRLLDWSEALGIAVAFVLHSTSNQGDAAVWVLDPMALNRLSGIEEIKRLPEDAAFEYKSIYWQHKPFAIQHPVAVYPPFRSERLFAQRGTFTIHGTKPEALEAQCPQVVRKVILSQQARKGARTFLEYANLDEYSIYPDIVGMAQYIKRKVFGPPTE